MAPMDSLEASVKVSASGMNAQSKRIRVATENLANEDSTSLTPGGEPYRRKTIYFKDEFDKTLGANKVKVAEYGVDKSDFKSKYDPNHPAAGDDGIVHYPNIERVVEMVDLKEAQRSYEANLNSIEVSMSMILSTLDIINR